MRLHSSDETCGYRDELCNLDQRIGPEHQRAVGGLVCKVRRDILDETSGIPHTPTPEACMKKVAERKCLYKLIAKHNNPRSTQDVKYDDIIYLGS